MIQFSSRSAAMLLLSPFLPALLSGCGGGSSPATTPVSMVMQDAPAANTSVLSFEIEITGAVLQPGNVQLIRTPVTVDLAQLAADTAFLASETVDSGTYTSLTLTFADPQLTLVNDTGSAIVTPGQTCASGAVCTFTPTLDTASLTISSGVFPITLVAGTPAGFDLDLSIPDLIQSDLSISFANGDTVNVSLLPGVSAAAGSASIESVLGTVKSVSGSQLTIQTALGATLVLDTDSGTRYDSTLLACSGSALSCLGAGESVEADLSLLGAGSLLADRIAPLAPAGVELVRGTVVGIDTAASPARFEILVHQNLPAGTGLATGDLAYVTLGDGAAYAIDDSGYPAVSGARFAAAPDLMIGQEVLAQVTSGLSTLTVPASFDSASLVLGSSQLSGLVDTVTSGSAAFTLKGLASFYTDAAPAITEFAVQTGPGTSFADLTPASVSGLQPRQLVSVKGPLFNTAASAGAPTVAAVAVRGH